MFHLSVGEVCPCPAGLLRRLSPVRLVYLVCALRLVLTEALLAASLRLQLWALVPR